MICETLFVLVLEITVQNLNFSKIDALINADWWVGGKSDDGVKERLLE